ncbi:hypothetical protein OYC64_017630 [Pagothenia borchgrevinki]
MSRTLLPGFSPALSHGNISPPPSSTSTGCRSSPGFTIKHSSSRTSPSIPSPPQYLSDLLHPYTPSRSLRSSDTGLLSIPRSRLRTVGDRAFSVATPTLWNALPAEIRNAASLDIFKSSLKTHLFTMAFGP